MAELPYIEVHLTDHCNLNCRGCGHFSPLFDPSFADPSRFETDMSRLAQLFDSVGRLHLLGGEPLLHPRVNDLLRIARAAFPDAPISLVTNGLLLGRMDDSFWSAVASTDTRVDVTRYPARLDVDRLVRLARAHRVMLRMTGRKERFFKIPLCASDTGDARSSFESCRHLFACPNLRDGRIYPCPTIPLASALTRAFGIELPPGPLDSLDIHHASAEEVLRFLDGSVPWCRNCRVEEVSWFDWGPSHREATEWL